MVQHEGGWQKAVYGDFGACAPAQVIETMAAGQNEAQYWGCSAMIDLGRDRTSRAAIIGAGGVEVATAAMARPDADDARCCLGWDLTMRQQCQWALNVIDPPAYALATYLCLLVAAAGCAVARQHRSRGLPACTRAGWLAALLLHLGAGAVLLTWAATLGDGAFAILVDVSLGIWSVVLVPGTALSGLAIFVSIWSERKSTRRCALGVGLLAPVLLVVCIIGIFMFTGDGPDSADGGGGSADGNGDAAPSQPVLFPVITVITVVVVVIWALAVAAGGIFVAWGKASEGNAVARCKPDTDGRETHCGHLCCCCAGFAGGTCVTLCTCAGTFILLWQVGYSDMAAQTPVDLGCILAVLAGCIFLRDGRAMKADSSGDLQEAIVLDDVEEQPLEKPAGAAGKADVDDTLSAWMANKQLSANLIPRIEEAMLRAEVPAAEMVSTLAGMGDDELTDFIDACDTI